MWYARVEYNKEKFTITFERWCFITAAILLSEEEEEEKNEAAISTCVKLGIRDV